MIGVRRGGVNGEQTRNQPRSICNSKLNHLFLISKFCHMPIAAPFNLRRWIDENKNGRPNYDRLRKAADEHPIEKVGAELRGMMHWITQPGEKQKIKEKAAR